MAIVYFFFFSKFPVFIVNRRRTRENRFPCHVSDDNVSNVKTLPARIQFRGYVAQYNNTDIAKRNGEIARRVSRSKRSVVAFNREEWQETLRVEKKESFHR